MLSCRGSIGGSDGDGREDSASSHSSSTTQRSSCELRLKPCAMRRSCRSARADAHTCGDPSSMLAQAARSSIHSGRRGDPGDDAGRGLDADDRAARPPFDGLESDRSPVQRMPAIVNRAVLPDMGRMNARSASGAAIGYSPIPWPVPTRAPGSIRLSSVPRRTGSSPTSTCVTCLPNCPTRNPSPTSKPCCRPSRPRRLGPRLTPGVVPRRTSITPFAGRSHSIF